MAYRRPVEDIPYIAYSPIIDRPRIRWPNDARVAFWIAANVEFYEFEPPPNPFTTIYGRGIPEPDVLTYSMLDYGNRVGFWRMLDLLDRYELQASVSLNVAVLDHFPEIKEQIVDRDWSIFSHGIYNTRFLYGMTPDQERAWVNECIESVRLHTGKTLRGMFGPAISMSPNSMNIWAEAGLTYVVDWFVDDQPFPILVPAGRMVDVPYSFEINDGLVMGSMPGRGGKWESDYFLEICKDQFDALYREGAEDGRVMCISLHPFVIGHVWRLRALERALDYILSHDKVWMTTAEEIADHYLEHTYDAALRWEVGASGQRL
jgi:peptidoglycan/xylan/chitin deacetylase (PgdA/CDA1 family)